MDRHVLLATDAFPPVCGGSGWSTYELAHGNCAPRGDRVTVLKIGAGARSAEQRAGLRRAARARSHALCPTRPGAAQLLQERAAVSPRRGSDPADHRRRRDRPRPRPARALRPAVGDRGAPRRDPVGRHGPRLLARLLPVGPAAPSCRDPRCALGARASRATPAGPHRRPALRAAPRPAIPGVEHGAEARQPRGGGRRHRRELRDGPRSSPSRPGTREHAHRGDPESRSTSAGSGTSRPRRGRWRIPMRSMSANSHPTRGPTIWSA